MPSFAHLFHGSPHARTAIRAHPFDVALRDRARRSVRAMRADPARRDTAMRADGMRVCITGATGFLGGALARALVAAGGSVHALRRRASSSGALEGVPVTWHEGDVTDPRCLTAFLTGADWVIHAAGRLGEANVPEDEYVTSNVAGTYHVMVAARAAGAKRVLHLSSPGVLGPTDGPAEEEAPMRPTNPYERSKAAAETVARSYALRGLPVVLARPGFIYGPGDRHVLRLFEAIQRRRFVLVSGGRCLCQPTYVDDAVAGMLACLVGGRPGAAYHLVGPRALTFRELAAAIADAVGAPAPTVSLPRAPLLLAAGALEIAGRLAHVRPPATRSGIAFFSENRVVSCRRAQDELGYAPLVDVAEGARRTVAWYRERAWL
jgi:nucleoside-diphosphate-sugar epimerase